MRVSEFVSASSRRAVMSVAVAALVCASSGIRAQQTAGQQTAGQQAAGQPAAGQTEQPKDDLKLNLDGPALIIFQVNLARVADFEALWTGVRVGLAKSEKPGLKEFAATLYPYRAQLPPEAPTAVYVFQLAAPSKEFSYNPTVLLYYTDEKVFEAADAKALYEKWNGAATGVQIWPLMKVGG